MTYESTQHRQDSIEKVNDQALKTLPKINEVLSCFHEYKILYCHWKSNQHLDASMEGNTDLDILFDKRQKEKIIELLDQRDFVRFHAIPQRTYKDIVDYLGFDAETGKIIHIHAHFKMTLGESYLKGYQWNIEESILRNRVWDANFSIYRSDPAHEIILLFVRHALKLSFRQKFRIALGRNKDIPENIYREFNWLRSKVTTEQINTTCNEFFQNPARIAHIIEGDLNYKNLSDLSNYLRREFKKYRLFNSLTGRIVRWSRELQLKCKRLIARRTTIPILQKRSCHGLVVALIGADGSGKSTIVDNIKRTFSKKLDVYPIYFGSGNFKSHSRRFAKSIQLITAKRKSRKSGKGLSDEHTVVNMNSGFRGFIKVIREVMHSYEIALVKKQQLKRMQEARKKGMIVICDRFPQNQFNGYNDGPRLNYLLTTKNIIARTIAKKEAAIYRQTDVVGPDLVFKLIADASVVSARKPGQTSLIMLEKKIEAIRKVQFPANTRVIEVDASNELDTVLRMVKSNIWRYIKSAEHR